MKKTIIIIASIVVIFCLNKSTSENMIRFRVIANSNNNQDQYIKKEVVSNISEIINETTKSNSIEETRANINSSLPLIDEKVNKTLLKYNQSNYNINYGLNYFPKKEINNKVYEEGMYESLVITIGEGKGDNFWCILFPPLCMIEDTEEYEYDSLIKKIITRIIKK